MLLRHLAIAAAVAFVTASALTGEEKASPLQDGATWEAIRYDVIGDVEVRDGTGLYTLEAPFRAHDAATVPVRIRQAEDAPDISRLVLVIDENPAPVAAEFTFGPAMQPVDLETRVRVDAYSNVRAIIETDDGTHYMTGRYVRASGGCSAPASKDSAEAMAALGNMKLRLFDPGETASEARREAQVMLRHPNYSGLQRNQITHLFIPAHFVDTLEVRQGDHLLFTMTGGISISEDPSFRFVYSGSGAALTVRATDTEGAVFSGSFPQGS